MTVVFLRVLTSLLLLTCLTAHAEPNYQKELQALPAMPPEPTIHGIRFSFYHVLRDLRQGVDRFTPGHQNYLYGSTPELAPDTGAIFETHVKLYRRLHALYSEITENGEIARYAPEHVTEAEDDLLPIPPDWRALLRVADRFESAEFLIHYQMGKLLTILNKQLWDHRFISQFLFTVTVDRRHRPLESVHSLSQSSQRTQALIDRWLNLLRTQILSTDQSLLGVTDLVLKGETRISEELSRAEVRAEKSTLLISLLVDSLYRGVQFANDVVRNHKTDLAALKSSAASLGDDLRLSLEEVDEFNPRTEEPTRTTHQLFNVQGELIRIFGEGAHYGGRTMSWDLRFRNPGFAQEVVKEAVILQHVLTMGSLLAKVAELPEGRGGFAARAVQEWNYLIARVRAPKADGPSGETSRSLIVPRKLRPLPTVQRRNFASPSLASDRARMEDGLWTLFFEHAQLFGDEYKQRECVRMIVAQPTDSSND